MTPQVIWLLFLPVLVVIDIWAIVIGSKGRTKVHIATRFAGIAGLITFLIFFVAFIDLFTQVWVSRPGGAGGAIYVASMIAFIVISVAAFALSASLRFRRGLV